MATIAAVAVSSCLYNATAQTAKTDTVSSNGAIPVKVMILSAFAGEAVAWTTNQGLNQLIPLPGLSVDYPAVACNDAGVCHVATGPGHANAAGSTIALLLSNKFDFKRTYFLIAGIAGVNPRQATIGSAAWARYVVDIGIINEFDAREMPSGWAAGYFGVRTRGPSEKPPAFRYHTEVFQLDEPLLQKVLALTMKAQLDDDDVTRAYRAKYGYAPANGPPAVMQCDIVVSDTFRRGELLAQHSEQWMRLLTDGAGTYCFGDQEDTAILNAMSRAARVG
jgi:purine nucleoside permease